MFQREEEEEIFLKKLGKRIAALRKERMIKQVDLAYACDIEKQSMSRIEKGGTNPSITLLKRIAAHLNMTLSELLDF